MWDKFHGFMDRLLGKLPLLQTLTTVSEKCKRGCGCDCPLDGLVSSMWEVLLSGEIDVGQFNMKRHTWVNYFELYIVTGGGRGWVRKSPLLLLPLTGILF